MQRDLDEGIEKCLNSDFFPIPSVMEHQKEKSPKYSCSSLSLDISICWEVQESKSCVFL